MQKQWCALWGKGWKSRFISVEQNKSFVFLRKVFVSCFEDQASKRKKKPYKAIRREHLCVYDCDYVFMRRKLCLRTTAEKKQHIYLTGIWLYSSLILFWTCSAWFKSVSLQSGAQRLFFSPVVCPQGIFNISSVKCSWVCLSLSQPARHIYFLNNVMV